MSETASVPPAAPTAEGAAPSSTPDQQTLNQSEPSAPVSTAEPVESSQPAAPAPEAVVNQSLTTEPEAQSQGDDESQSLLGDLLNDEAESSEPNYEYDYDDIQLEDGVVGTDADKAVTNAIAKELGLSRDQARLLYQRGGAIMRQQQQAIQSAQIKEWNTQIQSDPDIGGAKLESAKSDFRAALNAFGTPEFKEMLKHHPIYQNPEVFKFMVKAGRAISGDKNFTQGTTEQPRKLTSEERFLRQFPNSEYLLTDNFRQ